MVIFYVLDVVLFSSLLPKPRHFACLLHSVLLCLSKGSTAPVERFYCNC